MCDIVENESVWFVEDPGILFMVPECTSEFRYYSRNSLRVYFGETLWQQNVL